MEKDNHVQIEDDMQKGAAVKEEAVASAALAEALGLQKPSPLSKSMLKLYAIMGIGYLVSTMNGFDSSLMGAINAMPSYQRTFGLSGEGSTTGIIFIIYNLGQIAAFPFCGFFADGYGRRVCIFVGCLLVLVGTAVQTTAHEMGQFIAGRFVRSPLVARQPKTAANAWHIDLRIWRIHCKRSRPRLHRRARSSRLPWHHGRRL